MKLSDQERAALAKGYYESGKNSHRMLDYEKARLETTARIVRTNRQHPPDYLIMKVDELTGGRPFANIDDVISQEELRNLSEQYKRVAGFSLEKPAGG